MSRALARQRRKARTAAFDALIRAKDFLRRLDEVKTPSEARRLLAAMRKAGLR